MLKYLHQLSVFTSKTYPVKLEFLFDSWQVAKNQMAKLMINITQEQSCWGMHAEVSSRLQCAALSFEILQKKGSGKVYQGEKKIKNVPKCCVKAISERSSEMWHKQELSGWYWEPKRQCQSLRNPGVSNVILQKQIISPTCWALDISC